jgi:hypothetical protein
MLREELNINIIKVRISYYRNKLYEHERMDESPEL